MANVANLVYSGQGPSATGQVFADGVQPGPGSSNIDATASFTGDAATATLALGFIDGAQTLSFTPSAVIATRSGGAATSTIGVLSVTAITNVGCTVTFTGNVNAATCVLAVRIIR